MLGRKCSRWAMVVAFALALAWPAASGGAATTRTGAVPATLLGVWHKTMTRAEWNRTGVYPTVGVYTFVVKKTAAVTVYLPGDYRPGCSLCPQDFTTTFRTTGARLTLGDVPVCSFKGVYSWHLAGRTLIVTPVADTRCVVRETFFGGRWRR